MAEWIIHLKDGRTFTDKDGYPWDFPQDQITSVERIVNGKAYTICNSPFLKNFFVKTLAGQTISLMGGGPPSAPVIMERILGCFIETKQGFIRLELAINPSTGSCKLIAIPTKEISKDGF